MKINAPENSEHVYTAEREGKIDRKIAKRERR